MTDPMASFLDDCETLAACQGDVAALVNAVRAVLELHSPGPVQLFGQLCAAHASHRYFSITSAEAADVAACPKCLASVTFPCAGCGTNCPVDRCPTRAAISSALTGEEGA